MIGIRSITYELPEDYNKSHLDLILTISRLFARKEHFIRTQRLLLNPFKTTVPMDEFNKFAKICDESDIRWFNIPIDPWGEKNIDELFKFGENILSEFSRSFVNILTFKNGKVNKEILENSAKLIKRVGNMNNNGKDNFRLGLSANINADCPYFPFSFSSGEFGFSIGLELTQEINNISDTNEKLSLSDLRGLLYNHLKSQIQKINQDALSIEANYGLKFHGFDFSIAPIISNNGSVITLLHRLGIYNFGKTGTLFATAYYTDLIKSFRKDFRTVGFSGIMYSLLEDLELCRINNEKHITLEDLIKVSTMCGCGVDMVPVPDDITLNELYTILLEVYTISTRLHKPLGIRLLPIPYSKRNRIQYTNISDDADFIANTRILDLNLNIIEDIDQEFEFYN